MDLLLALAVLVWFALAVALAVVLARVVAVADRRSRITPQRPAAARRSERKLHRAA